MTKLETGLDLISPESRERLKTRYARFDNDAAREIIAWLDGADRFSTEWD